ncbi:MAG TPA: hypothetical protein VD902_13160, partial [Symbiobacteriaceae bacterium]|nr:hypothetical protein [Symbiobacteriaceae bacterium]
MDVLRVFRWFLGDAGTSLLRWLWPAAWEEDLRYRLMREALAAKAESPIEERMGRHLLNRVRYLPGWVIEAQVKVGKYRADLVVRRTLPDGRVLLVDIECDGEQFHGSAEARVRDRQRDEY